MREPRPKVSSLTVVHRLQHHTGVNNGQMARTGQDGTSKHERWDDRLKFRRIVSFTFSPFAFSSFSPDRCAVILT